MHAKLCTYAKWLEWEKSIYNFRLSSQHFITAVIEVLSNLESGVVPQPLVYFPIA